MDARYASLEKFLPFFLQAESEQRKNLTIFVIKNCPILECYLEKILRDEGISLLFVSDFLFTKESAKLFYTTDQTPDGVCYECYIEEKCTPSKIYIVSRDSPFYDEQGRQYIIENLRKIDHATNLAAFYQKANVILHQLLIEKQIDGFTMHDHHL